MSAMLDSLLKASGDAERLADIARNEAALGIPPAPPVELDEAYFRYEHDPRYVRALNRQIDANRRDPLMPRGAY